MTAQCLSLFQPSHSYYYQKKKQSWVLGWTAFTFYMLFISLFQAFRLWGRPREIYEHEKRQGAALPHSFQMASKARVGDDSKKHRACAEVLCSLLLKVGTHQAKGCSNMLPLHVAVTNRLFLQLVAQPLYRVICCCDMLQQLVAQHVATIPQEAKVHKFIAHAACRSQQPANQGGPYIFLWVCFFGIMQITRNIAH